MIPAPITENDADRVASLHRMNLLSTPREADIDRITRTAQKLFGTEIALVSLVDKDRQWFKSRCGLDATETHREISFCGHAIQSTDTFIVNDASKDERFHDNPLVTGGPNIRFYAGQPLENDEGFKVGTLCVISNKPRTFSDADGEALRDLGRMVEVVLENRDLSEAQISLLNSLAAAERDTLIDPLTGVWNRRGFDDLFERERARAVRQKSTLAVAMVDIDDFKTINDTFGRPIGDEAIKLAASLLVECCRTTDIVARYGGEEFALVAPGISAASLPIFSNKILRSFRTRAVLQLPQGRRPFTVSVGLTMALPGNGEPIDCSSLLGAADQALYAAKAAGKNRCEISGVPPNLYSAFALA